MASTESLTKGQKLIVHVKDVQGDKILMEHHDQQVAAYYLWEKAGRPVDNDLDHWYRAEKASDPSNAALTGAFFANGGPLYIPKGPAPGMVYDQLTVDQLAAAARAEAEQRIALARGGGFGPAGTEVESQHGEEVPSWARLVVGGDSAGGVDGGLPVWAQEIKDALPPSVLEQMAEGVKVRDPKMVKDALASLSTAEKDRLTEAVKDIPPDVKALLEKTFAPSVHHYQLKKRRKYGPDRVLEWVKATVTQTTTDAQGSVVGVKVFELEGSDAEKTVEEISKMVGQLESALHRLRLTLFTPRKIEEGQIKTPTSSD